MSDGSGFCIGSQTGGSFKSLLSKYIGETVTIFTKSGGQSGAGFTGVILSVNDCFVRLITRIGPPPACSLGNACTDFNVGYGYDKGNPKVAGYFNYGHSCGYKKEYDAYPYATADKVGAYNTGGWNNYPVYTVGSVTDIPISAIVSFVHNAV
ncbi:MAG: hypothetical protein GX383_10335 [Clostridium sp.]|jgi:hypothetical protein|nr:hypothetical protein [Clostridium sp.]